MKLDPLKFACATPEKPSAEDGCARASVTILLGNYVHSALSIQT
jgi:hypothetical protein